KLMASKSLEETWDVLCRESAAFGISGIEMQVDSETWLKRAVSCWHIRVDFPGRGYIVLDCDKEAYGSRATAGLFVECVARAFLEKLEELSPVRSELPVYAEA